MKSIKDLREQYDLITEKEEHDMNKLTQLVRAGLFDAKKLSALKRAMDKPADKMTAQEKRMMINLLDALMSEVLSDKQVYRKVKQDVMRESFAFDKNLPGQNLASDPRYSERGYPSVNKVPPVLLLKRKSIRIFPDGQKVALYYAQAINKYVTIPFNEIGINEDISIDENAWDVIKGAAKKIFGSGNSNNSTSSTSSDSEPKYLEPKTPKYKATISTPTNTKSDDESPAVASRTRQKYRKTLSLDESLLNKFKQNLEILREGAAPRPPKGYIAPKIRPKAGIGPGNKVAPEKSPWEKLTDISDDGTVKGLAKDLMPVVDTVRQAKRTSAAYNNATSEFKKGNYWNAAKGAADTALQGGLTGLSAAGDAATLTGIGAAVVEPVRGAIAATKLAKAASAAADVEKFIATSKTVPVKKTPALSAPKTSEAPANISASKANKIRNNTAADTAITKQTKFAAAGREAQAFREKYPRATAADKNAGTKVTTKPTSTEPKFEMPKTQANDRNAGARVTTKTKDTFKAPEVATNKGNLVPIKKANAADRNVGARVDVKDRPATDFKLAQPEPATSKGELTVRPNSDLTVNKPKPKDNTSVSTEVKTKTNTVTNAKTKTKTKSANIKRAALGLGLAAATGRENSQGSKNDDGSPLKPMDPKFNVKPVGPNYHGNDDATKSVERRLFRKSIGENHQINLDGNIFNLNSNVTPKVKRLYESLNSTNKKKMINLMNESDEELNKIILFATR